MEGKKKVDLLVWKGNLPAERDLFPLFKSRSFYKKPTVIRHQKTPSGEVFVPVQNTQMLAGMNNTFFASLPCLHLGNLFMIQFIFFLLRPE